MCFELVAIVGEERTERIEWFTASILDQSSGTGRAVGRWR
jgi:hypothetical protein